MGESTPEADLIYTVTWPSLFSVLDNGSDDLSMFTISGFNVSNLSRAGPYMEEEDVKRRGVGEENDGGIRPLNWQDLWRGVPLGIILACLCLLTTVGNILVLHAVRTEKRLQTVSMFRYKKLFFFLLSSCFFKNLKSFALFMYCSTTRSSNQHVAPGPEAVQI